METNNLYLQVYKSIFVKDMTIILAHLSLWLAWHFAQDVDGNACVTTNNDFPQRVIRPLTSDSSHPIIIMLYPTLTDNLNKESRARN